MNKKKIYEEAKIEVVAFECNDILTTSNIFWEEISQPTDNGDTSEVKTPEIGF